MEPEKWCNDTISGEEQQDINRNFEGTNSIRRKEMMLSRY